MAKTKKEKCPYNTSEEKILVRKSSVVLDNFITRNISMPLEELRDSISDLIDQYGEKSLLELVVYNDYDCCGGGTSIYFEILPLALETDEQFEARQALIEKWKKNAPKRKKKRALAAKKAAETRKKKQREQIEKELKELERLTKKYKKGNVSK